MERYIYISCVILPDWKPRWAVWLSLLFCEDLAACSTIVHISVGPGKSIVYNAGINELCGKSILLADDMHYGGSCNNESRSG